MNGERAIARINEIDVEVKDVDVMKRLVLLTERERLARRLVETVEEPNSDDIVAAFVKHAKAYGDAKGITWSVWRSIGVPPKLLREAGIRA